MDTSNDTNYKGLCPICERAMYDVAGSINRHHFIPKSCGGKEQFFLHKICHNFLHGLWTEKELEVQYCDPEIIKQQPEVQKFIAWVKKKDPLFYLKTKDANDRKVKRRGR